MKWLKNKDTCYIACPKCNTIHEESKFTYANTICRTCGTELTVILMKDILIEVLGDDQKKRADLIRTFLNSRAGNIQ